jgi:hypothetical protein
MAQAVTGVVWIAAAVAATVMIRQISKLQKDYVAGRS